MMNVFLAFFFNLVFHSILTFWIGSLLYFGLVKVFNVKNFRTLFLLRWIILVLPLLDFLKYGYASWTLGQGTNPLFSDFGTRELFVGLIWGWPPTFIFKAGFSLLKTSYFSLADVCFLSFSQGFQWILGLTAIVITLVGFFNFGSTLIKLRLFNKKIAKSCKPYPLPQNLNSFLKTFCQENQIRLAISSKIRSPCLLSRRRAMIVLPKNFIEKMACQEVEAILFHEIAHYLQKDSFFNLSSLILYQFFWFIPFYKKFAKKNEIFREVLCDRFVLKMGVCKKDLEKALVKTAHFSIAGLVLFSNFSTLSQRILILEKLQFLEKKENIVKQLLFWGFVLVFMLLGKFLIF